jgi:hypothetical protein
VTVIQAVKIVYFFSRNCAESDKIKWLFEEYKEPILSDDELELIKAISKVANKEYKYVARDGDGIIKLFEIKPSTDKIENYYDEYTYVYIGLRDRILFPRITHKDGLYDIENKCFIKE